MPYKNFQAAGTLSPDDVDGVVRDADSMFGWRPFHKNSMYVGNLDVSSLYVLVGGGPYAAIPRASLVGSDIHRTAIIVRQDDFAGRKTRLRLQAITFAAPGAESVDLDFGLFPFAQQDSFGSADTLQGKIAPTAVAGSAVRITNVPAGKIQHYYSGEFLLPQNGFYIMGATPLLARTSTQQTLIYLNLSYKRVSS